MSESISSSFTDESTGDDERDKTRHAAEKNCQVGNDLLFPRLYLGYMNRLNAKMHQR
jgi:hypothetical protein